MDVSTVGTVGLLGLVTALATGLGALPFAAVREVSSRWVARADAVAAGLMLGACFGLATEGTGLDPTGTFLGVQLGVLFVLVVGRWLHGREVDVRALGTARGRKAFLIVVVMTAHSIAEGVAVGASFADDGALAWVVTGAIALHNVPEGLAISAVLRGRGASIVSCAGWSVVTSLPQPLLAVPAFLFVESVRPGLPWALGFAAGAMVVMVLQELLPDAYTSETPENLGAITAVTLVVMLVIQDGLG